MKKLLYILLLFGSLVQAQFTAITGVIASSSSSAINYSLASATNYGTELDVATYTPEQIYWANDKLYVVDGNIVYQFSLSAGTNIDSATYDAVSQASSQTRSGFQISPDGTEIVAGNFTSPVDNYGSTMSTPWLLSSGGGYSALNLNIYSSDVRGWYWKPDGLKNYIIDVTSSLIVEFTISTAWTGTMTNTSSDLDISANDNQPAGLLISPDGKYLYYTNRGSDSIDEWIMATEWDASTGSYNLNHSIDTETTTPYDMCWFGDNKILVLDTSENQILQINLNN